jgi:hypothetical protein
MQSPEIAPAGPFESYGMGWIIESYHGLPLVWHGGNTKGFTSDLAFLPDADLGILTLTNAADANHFRNSVRQYIFELAFGLGHDTSMSFATAHAAQEAQIRAASETIVTQSNTVINPEMVTPYLGGYEYGVTLEMRGDELWLVGAFAQLRLVASAEASTYTGLGVFSVRFMGSDNRPILVVAYASDPTLILDKLS